LFSICNTRGWLHFRPEAARSRYTDIVFSYLIVLLFTDEFQLR
jgi:hypothetical protein